MTRLLALAAEADAAGKPQAAYRHRIGAAANRALIVYPGPVGRLLRDELNAYAAIPVLWSAHMTLVVDDILARPIPTEAV